MAVRGVRGRLSTLIVVLAAMMVGCSEPEPVVLSDEEMIAIFETRAKRYQDVHLELLGELIPEFDAGIHGPVESIWFPDEPVLAEDPRVVQLCDDMVAIDNDFDAALEGVERSDRFWELYDFYDGMPDVFIPAMLIVLEAEGMVEIPGYEVADHVNLKDRFPEWPRVDDLEVVSVGELDGWDTSSIGVLLINNFYRDTSDCYFDALKEQRTN